MARRIAGGGCVLAALILGMVFCGLAVAQDPQPTPATPPQPTPPVATPAPPPTDPQQLQPTVASFLVRADVDKGLRAYREGDTLTITAASEEDAYLYVLYQQADNQVFQVFPNARRADNRVKARQAVTIPDKLDMFRWVVGPPFGVERVKVIASKEPLPDLDQPAARAKFFNPVSPQTIKGIALELGKPTVTWAEDTVEVTTYAGNADAAKPGTRRVGLFIGLGQYEHLKYERVTSDGKAAQMFIPGHRDARVMAGALREIGKLSEARIITNEEATRVNVEQAITQWLPSVTRPGDTIVLFISARSMPLSQAVGGTREGTVIPMHEFVSQITLESLRKQKEDGKISRVHAMQLEMAEKLLRERGPVALAQQWGITDESFARWIQRLAGRQVIVLMDLAGVASMVGDPNPAGPMGPGLGRLTKLGQKDIAILGAAGEDIGSDVFRNPEGVSTMTRLLLQVLRGAQGSLSLDEANRQYQASFEAYLKAINAAGAAAGRPAVKYQPYYNNTCTQPVALKP